MMESEIFHKHGKVKFTRSANAQNTEMEYC